MFHEVDGAVHACVVWEGIAMLNHFGERTVCGGWENKMRVLNNIRRKVVCRAVESLG
jgi:hypothetical protein